jgi:hypothetical protein
VKGEEEMDTFILNLNLIFLRVAVTRKDLIPYPPWKCISGRLYYCRRRDELRVLI